MKRYSSLPRFLSTLIIYLPDHRKRFIQTIEIHLHQDSFLSPSSTMTINSDLFTPDQSFEEYSPVPTHHLFPAENNKRPFSVGYSYYLPKN